MQMVKWVMLFLTLLFVYHVREVFPPFVVGGIIAYLLFPLVQFVNRLKNMRAFFWMSPGVAIGLIYLLTAALLGAVVYKFGPTLADQITGLVEQRHELATNLVTFTSQYFNLQLDVHETSEQVLKGIENSIGKPEEIVHFGGMLSHGLLSLLVCIVSSIYFIVDSKRVGRFFLRFVPAANKTTMVNMIGQMNLMLSKYVVGQVILIALMSAVAWTFLTALFHLKYALLIAILSGCFEIIPVLGPFIAISIAVVVGVSQSGVAVALPIVGCFLIARWLEDYLVVPNIIGHAVELHPLAVIFAVLVGETMAGALGMLIAIPVAASVKVVIDTFYPPEDHQVHVPPKPNALSKLWNSLMNRGSEAKTDENEHCEMAVHPDAADMPLTVSEALAAVSARANEKESDKASDKASDKEARKKKAKETTAPAIVTALSAEAKTLATPEPATPVPTTPTKTTPAPTPAPSTSNKATAATPEPASKTSNDKK
jgi:predicted PurR-regulated permease PerM